MKFLGVFFLDSSSKFLNFSDILLFDVSFYFIDFRGILFYFLGLYSVYIFYIPISPDDCADSFYVNYGDDFPVLYIVLWIF